jgi:PAS domain-containing protein
MGWILRSHDEDFLAHPNQPTPALGSSAVAGFVSGARTKPMIVLDPNYNILAANTAYQRQFGSADKPFIGHKCYQISHHYDVPCDQAGENCPMKKAQEMRGPDRVLHIHHTPRGQSTSTSNCGRFSTSTASSPPMWSA